MSIKTTADIRTDVESGLKTTLVMQARGARVLFFRGNQLVGYLEPYITKASPFTLFTVSGTPTIGLPMSVTLTGAGITLTGTLTIVEIGNTISVQLTLTSDTTWTPSAFGLRFVMQAAQWGGRTYKKNGVVGTISDAFASSGGAVMADGALTSVEFTNRPPYRFLLTPGTGVYNGYCNSFGAWLELRMSRDTNISWPSATPKTFELIVSDLDPVVAGLDAPYIAETAEWAPYTGFAPNVVASGILDFSKYRTTYDPTAFVLRNGDHFTISGVTYKPIGINVPFHELVPALTDAAAQALEIDTIYSADIVRVHHWDGFYASFQGLMKTSAGSTAVVDETAWAKFDAFMGALWARKIRITTDGYTFGPWLTSEVPEYETATGNVGTTPIGRSQIKKLVWLLPSARARLATGFFNVFGRAVSSLGGSTLLQHPMMAMVNFLNEPMTPAPDQFRGYVRGDTAIDALYDAHFGRVFNPQTSQTDREALADLIAEASADFRAALVSHGYAETRPYSTLNWAGSGAQFRATPADNIADLHLYPALYTGAISLSANNEHTTKKRHGNRLAEDSSRMRKGLPIICTEFGSSYPMESGDETGMLGAGFFSLQNFQHVSMFNYKSNPSNFPANFGNTDISVNPITLGIVPWLVFVWRRGLVTPATGEYTRQSSSAAEYPWTDAERDRWVYQMVRATPDPAPINSGLSTSAAPWTGLGQFDIALAAGMARIVTPLALGASAEEGRTVIAGAMNVNFIDKGTVGIFSLDGIAIEKSKECLIQHLTRALWSGLTYRSYEKGSVSTVGSIVPLIRNAQATVKLTHANPANVQVFRVDPRGNIFGTKIPSSYDSTSVTFTLSGGMGGLGQIYYKLIEVVSGGSTTPPPTTQHGHGGGHTH